MSKGRKLLEEEMKSKNEQELNPEISIDSRQPPRKKCASPKPQ